MQKHLLLAAIFLASSSLIAQTTVTFNYTGSAQTFTVPPCVTSITVDVRGAQGGNISNATISPTSASGGMGGRVQGVIPVSPGQVLQINVGGQGMSNGATLSCIVATGGFGGGGTGYGGYNSYNYNASGGGGASDVRFAPYNLADRVVVSGGGGGACVTGCTGAASGGGAGGGLTGGNGLGGTCTPGTDYGRGGTPSAGGQAGTYWGAATAGSLGNGGAGAPCCAVTCGAGGGGGGGYYGGGGGSLAGGGGGSSYTNGSVTGVTHTQGFQNGNGQIIITYTPGIPAAAGPITGLNLVCAGSTSTYSITPVSGATSYNWTVPTGAVINSGQGTNSISVTFGSTSGNITVTPSNSCGSSAPSSMSVTVNSGPAVNLGTDITQCGGTAVLNAQNSGSSYLWSTGATTQTITVSSSGTYSVVVTNASGCTGSDAINVAINAPPTVALGNDITQCGGTAVLDAQNAGSTYLWSTNATTQTITVSSSGSYSVTVTDVNGCTGTDAINVTINTPPTVALGNDITQCGGTAVLDAQNAGSTYLWSTNATTQTITVSSSGSYSVTVTDVNGCTGTDAINVTINAPPTVALGNDVTQCGGTVMLDAQNTGSTYLWSDNSTGQTLSVSASGTYSVVVTDANGCTGTDAINVTINTPPTVNLGNDVTQCGGTVVLDAQNPGSAYLWANGATTQTLTVSASGTYSVIVTDANGCTGTDVIIVNINAPPVVSLSLNPSTVCITIPAYALTGGSPSGGTYSGNGVIAGSFDPAAAGLGTHTITYVFTDNNGCTDSATQVIMVDACTGVEQQDYASLVQVYPNPSSGVLYFTCPLNSLSLAFILTDVQGKVVYSNAFGPKTQHGLLDVSGLANGTYFLKITSGDHHKVQKVVIRK